MKGPVSIIIAVALLGFCAFTFVGTVNWQVKNDSYSIKFDTKGADGVIKGLKGTINFDEENLPQSNFDVTVDVNTLNTGNSLKNKHAKADDFFDVKKYPSIRYTSSKITRKGGAYEVDGKLQIKDIVREVVIPFTFNRNGNSGTFTGNFKINRKDYNLEKWFVGEVIEIEMVIPVIRK